MEKPVLVTGATGYVGGRLVTRLLAKGFRVRAMGRSLDKLACRPWAASPDVELVQADVRDLAAMRLAAEGCGVAYYLVHSMRAGGPDFAGADREAALVMARAADDAGVSRIIYLGGLGESRDELSPHLRSRHEVAKILSLGRVPVTHLRAAMILGAGSASFEIMRHLVERLPIMLAPKWVRTRCQPIAATNVLDYLTGCLESPATIGQTYDIGGPEILSYAEIFQIYAKEAGLPRRLIIPVPLLTPKLSAFWMQLLTPVPRDLIVPLIEGLRNEVVCRDNRIKELVPQKLLTCREAISRALGRMGRNLVETSYRDAGHAPPPEWLTRGDAAYAGGTVHECGYRATIDAPPEAVWRALTRIGGQTGWYYGDTLWRLRGFLDQLVGGISLGRGRDRQAELRVGDALDFWRIVLVTRPKLLLLSAEMRTPGEALLEFRLRPVNATQTEIVAHSRFLPRGLAGVVYWYVLYVPHQLVFAGLLRGLAKAMGKPLASPPQRFTPTLPFLCKMK